jgi:hypothetical protein
MRTTIARFTAVALLAGPLVCYADSSYEHTTQMTGGQLINTLKSIPFMGKQMRSLTDPISEITMVHGNQKAIVSKDYTEIWDLDKEQIIHIDTKNKSYSVVTFADMRKMIAELPAKMQEMQDKMKEAQAKAQSQQNGQPAVPPNLQFNFTTDVKDTGMTKMVDKYNVHQQIMTMKMTVTDTNNPGTNVAYSMTTEIWTTPDVPAEMKEVQDFDLRFAQKMMQGADTKDLMTQMQNMRTGGAAMMTQMFGAKPGAADAFAQAGKELAKIKGTRIIEITRMGGSGTGIQGSDPNAPPPPSGNQVAGQVATDTARNTSQSAASDTASHVGGLGGVALGSAMSGALGGMFGHKKPKPDTQNNNSTAPASTPATPAGQPATTDVTLMEMTTQTHDFSAETVPPSVFVIPAGFKQVESPMMQMMDKK